MTGYGRGECARDGFKITVELSSVNRKQSEIAVNLPRELEVLEAQIRDVVNRYISRGRLTARVSLHEPTGQTFARMHLNAPLAKVYARELHRLARALKLPGARDAGSSGAGARCFPNERGVGRGRAFLASGGTSLENGAGRFGENA